MMLLATACGGMLAPAFAQATITADESQAPYSPDFSDSSASPTSLATGTNQIIGGVALGTDPFDCVLFEGQAPLTLIEVFYQTSGNNGAIINLYNPSNNLFAGGSFVSPNTSGSFFANVPASGSLRAEINENGEVGGDFTNYTLTLPEVPEPSGTSLAMVALSAMLAKRRAKK